MILCHKSRFSLPFRGTAFVIILTFVLSSVTLPEKAQAQNVPISGVSLPALGTMISPSVAYVPSIMAGMTIHPENPLQFDFIIDTGDDNLKGVAFRQESQKLINYFLAALTVPENEMWVNLSPYEKDRIIADGLSQTEMGRDMLAQDYLLKQLTASLMYPEEELGSKFWNRVYEQAQEKYGVTDIPTSTFNKVWIVPDEATVYVNGTNVFVSESHLRVMLEEDYLAISRQPSAVSQKNNSSTADSWKLTATLIKEVIIPEIEREVNHGKNFANLRQIYHSMILATWYKQNLKDSVLGKVYVDANKVQGIDLKDKAVKDKLYSRYIAAFKQGVYDYIKEDYDPMTQQIIPRKYFSGGLKNVESVRTGDLDMGAVIRRKQAERVTVNLAMAGAGKRITRYESTNFSGIQPEVTLNEQNQIIQMMWPSRFQIRKATFTYDSWGQLQQIVLIKGDKSGQPSNARVLMKGGGWFNFTYNDFVSNVSIDRNGRKWIFSGYYLTEQDDRGAEERSYVTIKTFADQYPALESDGHNAMYYFLQLFPSVHESLRLVNFDLHHDAYRNPASGKRNGNGVFIPYINFTNWVLRALEEGYVNAVTWIYPSWHDLSKDVWIDADKMGINEVVRQDIFSDQGDPKVITIDFDWISSIGNPQIHVAEREEIDERVQELKDFIEKNKSSVIGINFNRSAFSEVDRYNYAPQDSSAYILNSLISSVSEVLGEPKQIKIKNAPSVFSALLDVHPELTAADAAMMQERERFILDHVTGLINDRARAHRHLFRAPEREIEIFLGDRHDTTDAEDQFYDEIIPKILRLAKLQTGDIGIHVMPARDLLPKLKIFDPFSAAVNVVSREDLDEIRDNEERAREFVNNWRLAIKNTVSFGFKTGDGELSVPIVLFVRGVIKSRLKQESIHRDRFSVNSFNKEILEKNLPAVVTFDFDELDQKGIERVERLIFRRYIDKLLEIAESASEDRAREDLSSEVERNRVDEAPDAAMNTLERTALLATAAVVMPAVAQAQTLDRSNLPDVSEYVSGIRDIDAGTVELLKNEFKIWMDVMATDSIFGPLLNAQTYDEFKRVKDVQDLGEGRSYADLDIPDSRFDEFIASVEQTDPSPERSGRIRDALITIRDSSDRWFRNYFAFQTAAVVYNDQAGAGSARNDTTFYGPRIDNQNETGLLEILTHETEHHDWPADSIFSGANEVLARVHSELSLDHGNQFAFIRLTEQSDVNHWSARIDRDRQANYAYHNIAADVRNRLNSLANERAELQKRKLHYQGIIGAAYSIAVHHRFRITSEDPGDAIYERDPTLSAASAYDYFAMAMANAPTEEDRNNFLRFVDENAEWFLSDPELVETLTFIINANADLMPNALRILGELESPQQEQITAYYDQQIADVLAREDQRQSELRQSARTRLSREARAEIDALREERDVMIERSRLMAEALADQDRDAAMGIKQPVENKVVTKQVTVTIPSGIHARPSVAVFRLAEKYKDDHTFTIESVVIEELDDVMLLGVSEGEEVTLEVYGPKADELLFEFEKILTIDAYGWDQAMSTESQKKTFGEISTASQGEAVGGADASSPKYIRNRQRIWDALDQEAPIIRESSEWSIRLHYPSQGLRMYISLSTGGYQSISISNIDQSYLYSYKSERSGEKIVINESDKDLLSSKVRRALEKLRKDEGVDNFLKVMEKNEAESEGMNALKAKYARDTVIDEGERTEILEELSPLLDIDLEALTEEQIDRIQQLVAALGYDPIYTAEKKHPDDWPTNHGMDRRIYDIRQGDIVYIQYGILGRNNEEEVFTEAEGRIARLPRFGGRAVVVMDDGTEINLNYVREIIADGGRQGHYKVDQNMGSMDPYYFLMGGHLKADVLHGTSLQRSSSATESIGKGWVNWPGVNTNLPVKIITAQKVNKKGAWIRMTGEKVIVLEAPGEQNNGVFMYRKANGRFGDHDMVDVNRIIPLGVDSEVAQFSSHMFRKGDRVVVEGEGEYHYGIVESFYTKAFVGRKMVVKLEDPSDPEKPFVHVSFLHEGERMLMNAKSQFTKKQIPKSFQRIYEIIKTKLVIADDDVLDEDSLIFWEKFKTLYEVLFGSGGLFNRDDFNVRALDAVFESQLGMTLEEFVEGVVGKSTLEINSPLMTIRLDESEKEDIFRAYQEIQLSIGLFEGIISLDAGVIPWTVKESDFSRVVAGQMPESDFTITALLRYFDNDLYPDFIDKLRLAYKIAGAREHYNLEEELSRLFESREKIEGLSLKAREIAAQKYTKELTNPDDVSVMYFVLGLDPETGLAQEAKDQAMEVDTSKKDVGGIDFNPENLNLKQQGQALEFKLDNSMLQRIQPNAVLGIQPVIINITPITNFAPLLGLAEETEKLQLTQS